MTITKFGEQSSSGDVIDSGNTNTAIGSKFTNATTGNVVSLSMYITTVAGQLNLGIYEDNGFNAPHTKIAETGLFTPTTGWNTVSIGTPVAVTPGSYWLAFAGTDGGLEYPAFFAAPGYFNTSSLPGEIPVSWTSVGGGSAHWAIYASVDDGGGGGGGPTIPPNRRALLGVGI